MNTNYIVAVELQPYVQGREETTLIRSHLAELGNRSC